MLVVEDDVKLPFSMEEDDKLPVGTKEDEAAQALVHLASLPIDIFISNFAQHEATPLHAAM